MPASTATMGTHEAHGPSALSSPSLASAPDGLSARRVEHWLELPPGAWQRRRLYALRVNGTSFESIGLRGGDIVVVEPGAHDRPGRLVVTRSSRGVGIRRIPVPRPPVVDRRMPTVLELPFTQPQFERHDRVVGAIIGILRPTGTGALRPVPLSAPRIVRRGRHHDSSFDLASRETPSASRPESFGDLHAIREEWHQWMAQHRHECCSSAGGRERIERWERLDASLHALCDCLDRTHSANLRAALAEQTRAVIAAIRAEMRG